MGSNRKQAFDNESRGNQHGSSLYHEFGRFLIQIGSMLDCRHSTPQCRHDPRLTMAVSRDNPVGAGGCRGVPLGTPLQPLLDGSEAGAVLCLEPGAYAHPEFPNARTSTPLLVRTDTTQGGLYREERFGPIGFVIACDDADDALAQASGDVKRHGGLTAFLYSRDEALITRAEDAYARAGAQLTINLTGCMA